MESIKVSFGKKKESYLSGCLLIVYMFFKRIDVHRHLHKLGHLTAYSGSLCRKLNIKIPS
jgi:hypothetical protein